MPPLIFLCRVSVVEVDVGKLNVDGNSQLKKNHSYYYQVQQQLFSVPNLQHDDFVVYAIDKAKNSHFV